MRNKHKYFKITKYVHNVEKIEKKESMTFA